MQVPQGVSEMVVRWCAAVVVGLARERRWFRKRFPRKQTIEVDERIRVIRSGDLEVREVVRRTCRHLKSTRAD